MLKELGKYKDKLSSILIGDEYIPRLLLEDASGLSNDMIAAKARKNICPHLYVEPAASEPDCYIFLETDVAKTTPSTKTIKIVIQPVCHKDILTVQNGPAVYYGTRYDMLAERIDELLCPADKLPARQRQKEFGIGLPELQSVETFTSGLWIGRKMTYLVPDFRRKKG
ncbi:hypothetical protein [Frisingicoccus sp.]|uniref:hypothetical protein n=1 Tax=Frisingicoccus sp. TaxID=1918627 RepID=UPI003AB3B702